MTATGFLARRRTLYKRLLPRHVLAPVSDQPIMELTGLRGDVPSFVELGGTSVAC
jgi:hypothetical protein